jgi:hypothetical protein
LDGGVTNEPDIGTCTSRLSKQKKNKKQEKIKYQKQIVHADY